MKIAFYTAGVPFAGDALESGALGGIGTALIQVTRALARRGHDVSVFNNCPQAGFFSGVAYYPFNSSLPLLANEEFDVLVVSRYFGFFNLPVKAGLKVLWNHDTLDSPKDLRAIHDEIDIFLVLSRFHADNYLTRLPELDDRLVITRNGLDFDLLDQGAAGAVKNPHKLIYASRPERGLKPLLEDIWPRLQKARPDLELHLCGYSLNHKDLPSKLQHLYDHLDLLIASTPGVVVLGALGKKDYYRHLAESALMIYPSIFPEVSCLAVLEAQALGTAVLTSDAFALSESVVEPAFKVGGRPASPAYNDKYVERALRLLDNFEKTGEMASQAAQTIRARYSWDQVAVEWERMFNLSLKATPMPEFLPKVEQQPNVWLV